MQKLRRHEPGCRENRYFQSSTPKPNRKKNSAQPFEKAFSWLPTLNWFRTWTRRATELASRQKSHIRSGHTTGKSKYLRSVPQRIFSSFLSFRWTITAAGTFRRAKFNKIRWREVMTRSTIYHPLSRGIRTCWRWNNRNFPDPPREFFPFRQADRKRQATYSDRNQGEPGSSCNFFIIARA